MTTPPDDRSSQSVGMAWASRGLTVSMEMVIPGVIGLWLDSKFGSNPWLTVAGFALGLVLGMWHLIQMANGSKNTQDFGDMPPIKDAKRSDQEDVS